MPDDTPTVPEMPLPSAKDIVAIVGKQPLSKLIDLNGDGVPDWNQKWFRDLLAGGAFRLLAYLFPKSPWALLIKQYEVEITNLLETGAQ